MFIACHLDRSEEAAADERSGEISRLFYVLTISIFLSILREIVNIFCMKFEGIFEKTLVIVKPDGVQRGLIGDVINRLEKKGLKIAGMKMVKLGPDVLRKHYEAHVEKPFYGALESFMSSSPVTVLAAEGLKAVSAVRLIAGATNAADADGGTIRGDLAMGFSNVVHCSDSIESAKQEIELYFGEGELFDYDKTEYLHVYMDDERATDLNV